MKSNTYFINTVIASALMTSTNALTECETFKKNTTHIAPFYNEHYPFSLEDLPYKYNALEPYIDEKTMETHHTKHHKTYIDNLNNILKDYPKLHQKTLFELLSQIDSYPTDIKTGLRNNAGGHFNHSLFWRVIKPGGSPISKDLALQITKNFGSFEAFQDKFNHCAKSLFGSGWVWLVTNPKGDLSIITTNNQDNPLSKRLTPILCLDVWEHAYYLKYQNRRGDYIKEFWHIINWEQIERYYKQAIQKS